MKNKIICLRICYRVGALADSLATLRMLFPRYAHGAEYRYALGLGASLMLGWTILLLWADRKPPERKGVILLTAFPVLPGLLLAEIYFVPLPNSDMKFHNRFSLHFRTFGVLLGKQHEIIIFYA